jgi:mycothiol synthase
VDGPGPDAHGAAGLDTEVLDGVGAATAADVDALLAAVTAAGEPPALAEHKLLELRRGTGFTAVLVRASSVLVGYGQLAAGNESWGLEIALDPAHGGDRESVRRLVLASAVDAVARRGGGMLQYWAHGEWADAGASGFHPSRVLLQMRTPLPVPPERRGDPPAVQVRAFRPGHDEHEWLAVNNRAFAHHPEQGAWDLAALEAREAEPWFDPDGFLIYEADGSIAASCWTKVHTESEPPVGEIYVISVDPRWHGHGLGRALTLAGLDWLAERVSFGMLYVDESNTAAVALYESLGMTVARADRVYARDVAPGAPVS